MASRSRRSATPAITRVAGIRSCSGELLASVRSDGLAPTAASAAQIRSLAPESIARSVVVRLGRVSPAAVALARCVALLGSEAELRHAAALAELDMDVAAATADALVSAGLLDAGRPLRLVHPVVRASIYAELRGGERARLHGRAARLLADEDGDVDAIAAHLLASEPAGERRTVELLMDAVTRATARGAPAMAAAYLRRAQAEPPSGDQRAPVLRQLAVVESRLGVPEAGDHADHAMRVASDPHTRAHLAADLSVAYLVAGRFAEAVWTLEGAVRHVGDGDRELRWELIAQLITVAGIDRVHAEVAERHLAQVPLDLPGDTAGERAILAVLAVAALRAANRVEVVGDLA